MLRPAGTSAAKTAEFGSLRPQIPGQSLSAYAGGDDDCRDRLLRAVRYALARLRQRSRINTRGQRARVDEMIWEAEKDAEDAELRTPDETPEGRSSEFRAELLEALEERLQQAPHRALQEAVNQ
jgi:hypothetical protein